MSIPLVLASSSASRRLVLEAAGVPFSVAVPTIDEEALKTVLLDAGKDGFGIAGELARAKALSVSNRVREALVLGADQVLVCEDRVMNKALTESDARKTLNALSGREHRLISAVVITRGADILWQTIDVAALRMRRLSAGFVNEYLAAELPDVLGSVGCYRIEGRGAQLFSEVSGDYFGIRGLPLIPILGALRDFGIISA